MLSPGIIGVPDRTSPSSTKVRQFRVVEQRYPISRLWVTVVTWISGCAVACAVAWTAGGLLEFSLSPVRTGCAASVPIATLSAWRTCALSPGSIPKVAGKSETRIALPWVRSSSPSAVRCSRSRWIVEGEASICDTRFWTLAIPVRRIGSSTRARRFAGRISRLLERVRGIYRAPTIQRAGQVVEAPTRSYSRSLRRARIR
jgi:hypothetical protein